MCSGDHACLLYGSEEERSRALLAFVRSGLAREQKVVQLTVADRIGETESMLAGSGPDLAAALADGRLRVDDAAGQYLASGRFDGDETIERLRAQIAAASDEGFDGLRIAADMSWALTSKTDPIALVEYEERVDELLRETGTAALCQYDSGRFELATTRETERVHHLVLAERDGDGGAPCELLVERGPNGETILRGEADGLSCESLGRSLAAATTRSDDLRLDLSDLSFVGAAGLRKLQDAAEAIETRGGTMTLVAPRPVVRQVVGLMGLTQNISIEDVA